MSGLFTRSRQITTAATGLMLMMTASAASAVEPTDTPAPVTTISSDQIAELPRTTTVLPSSTIFGSDEAVNATPGSGAYLDTQDIRQQTYDDINRVLRRVPGVYLREEDGYGLFPNISLRGVDAGRSAKVTIMEDGILQAPAPYSDPSAYYSPTTGRMYAIEVLKGSSQVRFGPHITGGAINYISTPIPAEQRGYLKAIYGETNEIRIHTHFGSTIDMDTAGRFGFLVEGYYRSNDGFKEFSPTTADFRGGDTGIQVVEPMVKLMWEPDSAVYQRFEFKYGYTDRHHDGGYLGLSEDDYDRDPYALYPGARFDQFDAYQNRTYLKHYAELTNQLSVETTAYYNNFSRNWNKLDTVNGTSLSLALAGSNGGMDLATLRGEGAGNLNVRANSRDYYSWGVQTVPRFEFDLGETQHTVEVGLRVHYDKASRLQWSTDYTQDGMGNIIGAVMNPIGSAGNREEETTALALHVRDEIKWGQWTFVPGFRFEHLWQEYTDFASDKSYTETASDSGEMDLFGGGLGMTYDATEELQFYGGAHFGFSPPSPRAHLRSDLDEETSLSFELGLRYAVREHAFRVEATGFFTMFDDLIAINNIGGVGAVDGTPENVGEVESYGIELLVEYDPGQAYGWGFNTPTFMSFTWTDATLESDTGGDAESIFSGGVKGNKVPYIPEYQLTLGTGIEVPDTFGVFVTGNFVSEAYATASNTSLQERPDGTPDARFGKIDDRIIVDLTAYYQLTDSARLVGGVHNLFDEEYIASRLPHGPRPGMSRFAYIGVEIEF